MQISVRGASASLGPPRGLHRPNPGFCITQVTKGLSIIVMQVLRQPTSPMGLVSMGTVTLLRASHLAPGVHRLLPGLLGQLLQLSDTKPRHSLEDDSVLWRAGWTVSQQVCRLLVKTLQHYFREICADHQACAFWLCLGHTACALSFQL